MVIDKNLFLNLTMLIILLNLLFLILIDLSNILVSSKVYNEESYYEIINILEELITDVKVKFSYEYKEVLIEFFDVERKYYILPLEIFGDRFKAIRIMDTNKAKTQLQKIFDNVNGQSKLELAKWQKPTWIEWNKILPSKEEDFEDLKDSNFDIFYDKR